MVQCSTIIVYKHLRVLCTNGNPVIVSSVKANSSGSTLKPQYCPSSESQGSRTAHLVSIINDAISKPASWVLESMIIALSVVESMTIPLLIQGCVL